MKRLLITFLAIALLTGCTNFFPQKTKDVEKTIAPETIENIKIIPQKTSVSTKLSGEKTNYRDDVLKISFEYPKEWGEVIISNENNSLGQNLSYEMAFSNLGHFLRANDPKIQPDGRGGYWGDLGNFITSISALQSFCKDERFVATTDNCEVFTNKNGIKIIKQRAPTFCMEEECKTTPQTNQYHFYNPYSNFLGISLSPATINVNSEIDDLNKFEEQFFELVNSITFS